MKLLSYKVWNNSGANWLDYLIGIFSFGKYSHTEIMFSDGVCFSISPRDKVARFKKFNVSPERWDIIELNLGVVTEKQILRQCQLLEKKQIKYDYIGALTSVFKLCTQNEKLFCSEVCADLLRANNVLRLQKGCRYTPSDLQKTIKEMYV